MTAAAIVWGAVLSGTWAAAQSPPTVSIDARGRVLHERLPRAPGLRGASPAQPVWLRDDDGSEDATDAPAGPASSIRGSASPAPAAVQPPSERLVYRAAAGRSDVVVEDVGAPVRLDRRTEREGVLHYHAVFDPSVAPFKRNVARDTITPDFGITTPPGPPRPLPADPQATSGPRELLWGTMRVALQPGVPVPIPTPAPGVAVLQARAVPDVGPLRFLVDDADNLYVEAAREGLVRLHLLLDAPADYFGRPVELRCPLGEASAGYPGRRPPLPPAVQRAGLEVAAQIGVDPTMPADEALDRLVQWFRSFEPAPAPPTQGNLYRALATSRTGVCRHRALAFVVTAQALGLVARYVSNEAHAFAEVWLGGTSPGWLRVDLGGGAEALVVHGGQGRALHVPAQPDPFGQPAPYADTYTGGRGRRADGGLSGLTRTPAPPGATDDPIGRLLHAPSASARATDRGGGAAPQPQISVSVDTRVAYRGEPLTVRGHVTQAGHPQRGTRVQVWLTLQRDAAGASGILLAVVRTDAQGAFVARARLPAALPPGSYRIVATTEPGP